LLLQHCRPVEEERLVVEGSEEKAKQLPNVIVIRNFVELQATAVVQVGRKLSRIALHTHINIMIIRITLNSKNPLLKCSECSQ
jgi:hypothetical protein